jgi:putative transposase
VPRPKRIQYEGAVYHVTSRGNERRNIVGNDSDRWLFVRTLKEMVDDHGIICHAWVLMNNHYHLLLETPSSNLSLAMKHFNGIFTQKFNRANHRVGHLFQGRYKAIVVDKNTHLQELCRYVVLNPVRAGMVKDPQKWKWSSYLATAGLEKAETWLEISWILGQFGKNLKSAQTEYRKFVQEGIKKKTSPWEEITSQVYLGGEKFLEKMEGLIKGNKTLDIPKYQKKVLRPAPERVLLNVAKMYGVKLEDIQKPRSRNNEARDVAIYLLKKESGLSSKAIGQVLGVIPSAIGNRWNGMKRRVAQDKALAQRIAKCQMLA